MKSVILLIEITKETLQDVKLSIKKYNRFFLLKEIIKTEEKEIYIYGVQLIISSIINFLICIITSLLFGELLNGLIFFVAFSSLRKFTGGFHSRCFLICNIVFTMIVLYEFLFFVVYIHEYHLIKCYQLFAILLTNLKSKILIWF